MYKRQDNALRVKDEHRLISEEELKREETALWDYREALGMLRAKRAGTPAESGALLEKWLEEKERDILELERAAEKMLERAFSFLEDTVGDGAEMGYFMTALTQAEAAAEFLNRHPSSACGRHLKALSVTDEEEELKRRIREAAESGREQ